MTISPFWTVTRPDLPRRRPAEMGEQDCRAVLDRIDPDGRDIYAEANHETLRAYLQENLTNYGEDVYAGVVYTADTQAAISNTTTPTRSNSP